MQVLPRTILSQNATLGHAFCATACCCELVVSPFAGVVAPHLARVMSLHHCIARLVDVSAALVHGRGETLHARPINSINSFAPANENVRVLPHPTEISVMIHAVCERVLESCLH
jgi:hypothetical protein